MGYQKSLSKKPYDNCKVYHPNGELMFFCSKKKFNWYKNRGLGNLIGENELKLTFIPKGMGESEKFLAHRKKNLCVITGVSENLTKHHVIPYQYRKHFPNKYKNANSLDVVVLEREAHNNYELEADKLKNRLFKEHITFEEIKYNEDLGNIKKILITIEKHSEVIPDDRLVNYHLKLNKLLDERNFLSENVMELEPFNLDKLIVERVGYEDMILLWKNHFVLTTDPAFLPDWWDPNYINITST